MRRQPIPGKDETSTEAERLKALSGSLQRARLAVPCKVRGSDQDGRGDNPNRENQASGSACKTESECQHQKGARPKPPLR